MYIHRFGVLILAIALVLSGCSLSGNTPAPQQPAEAAPQLSLFVYRANALVTKRDGNFVNASENNPVAIEAGDKIVIGPGGRAELLYGSRLSIEFLQTAELILDDFNVLPGDTLQVKTTQSFGHIHATINKDANVRLTVETSIVSIRNLVDDTEFIVCHDATLLTCKDVLRGEIEAEAQGSVRTIKAEEATYTLLDKTTNDPICQHTDELQSWLAAMRNGEKQPALGELVATWYNLPCPGQPTATSTATLAPEETPIPTATATTPAGPYVEITGITVNAQGRYEVQYVTYGFTEKLPGQHIHFFFNTVYPESAGVPGGGPWLVYGGPSPFTGYMESDKTAAATQMCALVANPDHTVQPNSGNCFNLP